MDRAWEYVEIGIEAAQFIFCEYINPIFFAVYTADLRIRMRICGDEYNSCFGLKRGTPYTFCTIMFPPPTLLLLYEYNTNLLCPLFCQKGFSS
jgi:hypothetical protein